MTQYFFVDESGDPGLEGQASSSSHFVLVFNTAASGASAVENPTETSTPSLTMTPTLPAKQPATQAWLDASIDPQQFSPNGSLIVHFNTPMDESSSRSPLLSWPSVEGSSHWDISRTILTFSPGKLLDNNAAYTFFPNPTLRSSEGKPLENLPEWQVLTREAPKVVRIFPPAGDLDRRYGQITITFDQAMKTSPDREIISIDPPLPAELHWKTPHILQIKLETPFAFGQRYRLTLHKGLFTVAGSYLDEDQTWFYQQLPVQAQVESVTNREVKIAFNYQLDRQKTSLAFSVSPELEGTWTWASERQMLFKSASPIPADRLYTIKYPALVDLNGFDVPAPSLQFSGPPPILLLTDKDYQTDKYNLIKQNEVEGITCYNADEDLDAIRLEFLIPVDRASAEKAFALAPAVKGAILWETGRQNRDILVYELEELFQEGTEHILRLDCTVLDAQGRPIMVQPFSAKIVTTGYVGTFPSFGALGHNIQVLDIYGPRRLQYAAGKEQANFTAYRLDLADFVKLYPPDRVRAAGARDIPIPVQDSPAASWSNSSERKIDNGQTIVETVLPSNLGPGLYIVNVSVGNTLYD